MKFSHQTHRRTERGSSLLLVIWVIILMSFAVMGVVESLDRSVDEDVRAEKEFQAKMLAESGLVLAQHPAIKPWDPLLRQSLSAVRRYEVNITTEGARINVNHMGNLELRRLARDLLVHWQMEQEMALRVTDCLADWIDGDDDERVYGAERAYYLLKGVPEYPKNRHFHTLDELLQVANFEEVVRLKPDWRNYFTTYGDGKIDVHEASAEMLHILLGIELDSAQTIVDERLGSDRLRNTEDDVRFKSVEQVRRLVGIRRSDFARVSPVLTLAHGVRRIESTGYFGNTAKTLVLITGQGNRVVLE